MQEPLSPPQVLSDLWHMLGGDASALDAVTLNGSEPVLPSSFAVSTAAQASIAASTLATRELGRLRGGPAQQVSVDMRHAAIEFRSERWVRIDGAPPPDPWDPLAGLYPCRDGWVRLHTNFPHHRDGVLKLLGCAGDRDAVAQALAAWDGFEFEDAAARAGMCVAALRSFEQWDAHAQGQAVAALPLLEIERIGDAAPAALPPLPRGAQPLHGVRVLDLTRVIAGPVAARTLAAHGADVLLITGPHLPTIASLIPDTGRGKRAAQLDLRTEAGRAALQALVRDADVFLQAYRPGALGSRGFAPDDLARLKPGIVCATLSAYGTTGPWAGRRGFDSLVQTASGFNVAEAQAAGSGAPKPLPAQALDHGSGYLLAAAIQCALARRHVEGGSWHVRLSLAQTGCWLRGLGRVPNGLQCPEPARHECEALLDTSASPLGSVQALRHSGLLSATPPRWRRAAVPLDHDDARWLDAG